MDILRSIRRAVLVVGKLHRHHEEVEGARPAQGGESDAVGPVLSGCEENACVKMAPFEILDTCERVLIPYLVHADGTGDRGASRVRRNGIVARAWRRTAAEARGFGCRRAWCRRGSSPPSWLLDARAK